MKLIFGASNGGKLYLKKRKIDDVDFFIDNNYSNFNNGYLGYEVKSPEILATLDKRNLRIIVASYFFDDIKKQLIGYDLEEDIHFWDGLKEIEINEKMEKVLENLHLFSSSSIFDMLLNVNLEKNIKLGLGMTSLIESVNFAKINLVGVPSFNNKFELLKYCLDKVSLNGLFLEFGVYKGDTINYISNFVDKIYGFDSFEGLPEDWREGYPKNHFKLKGLPKVNKNVILIKGWFNETIEKFVNNNEESCAFIHIDCDLYSSTKTIFDCLDKKIKPGTIIIFDEFFNYDGWKNGEYKAFNEFIDTKNIKFKYIGYCHYHEQVAVQII